MAAQAVEVPIMTASDNQGWRPPRRWPTRLYLFCLVLLSCFLVTMFVCGERTQLYVAALTVDLPLETGHVGEASKPSVRDSIGSDANLLQVAADLGLQNADDPADDQPALATLRAGLRLREDSDAQFVTIEYADRDAARAVAVARQLADRQAGAQRRQAAVQREAERRKLHDRVREARAEQDQAEARLQRYLDETVPEVEQPVTVFEFGQPGESNSQGEGDVGGSLDSDSGLALAGPGGSGGFLTNDQPAATADGVLPGPVGIVVGPGDVGSPESATVNPPQDLNAQIDALVRQRNTMLEEMTTAHPQVQEITKKIAQLREQAAIAGAQEPALDGTSAAPLTREQRITLLKEAETDQGRQYRALLGHVELAGEAVAAAELAEQRAWQQPGDSVPLAAVGPLQQGIAWDRDRWIRVASMAIILAGAMAMVVVLLAGAGETTYLSVEQAAGELPVPVVGVLSTGRPAGLSGPRLAAWLARGIKLTCEVGVVALVLWVVVLLVRDQQLLAQVRENPLSITSAAWQHTAQFLSR